MRKGIVAVGALLILFFLPFTVYALSFNDSVPLNSEYRASPGAIAILTTLWTIGLVLLIIGIGTAPSEKKTTSYSASEDTESEP